MAHKRSPLIERLFRAAVILKGLDGASQLLLGITLLFIPVRTITDLVRFLMTRDLGGRPTGPLTLHIQNAMQGFASGGTHTFVIVFLLAHGVIKLGLVAALLRHILPVYPIAVAALAVFVVFELIRAVHTHSITLPFFAAVDVLIIVVVIREYVQLRRMRAGTGSKLPNESHTG